MLTAAAVAAFWVFFQLSKSNVFAAVNPFAEDPFDAVGSIAVQVALLVSVLSVARALRYAGAAGNTRSRLIVHGNLVALLAIAVTLASYLAAEVQRPTWNVRPWGTLLAVGIGAVAALAATAGVALAVAAQRVPAGGDPSAEPQDLGALAEALDDLWALIWVVLAWLRARLPWLAPLFERLEPLGRTALSVWLDRWPWVSPRRHPWRFCAGMGVITGAALFLAKLLEEGAPVDWTMTLAVLAIFVTVETVAVLLAMVIVGGYLGLRPPIRLRSK